MLHSTILSRAWQMAGGYLFSKEWKIAWSLVSAVIILNLLMVYIAVQVNMWHVNFYNIIQSKETAGFLQALLSFGGLAAGMVFIKGMQVYFRLVLHIYWRKWLTARYIERWMKNRNYYCMELAAAGYNDNPDQRMSEDIDIFIAITLKLFLECMQDILLVASFIVILWDISGVIEVSIGNINIAIYGYLVWAALLYAMAGTYLTMRLGAPLAELDYGQQKQEADFRYSLMRIREYGESIAMYHGEKAEKHQCQKIFGRLWDNFREIILVRQRLMWVTTGYSYTAVVFAIMIASPRYFANKISLGQMFQIIDAFNQVQSGMSFLIDSFSRLAQWKAVILRLHHFLICMENIEKQRLHTDLKTGCNNSVNKLSVVNVNVYQPSGRRMLEECSFELMRGERMMISGASGCGKSTFIRTLAGLWMFADGRLDWGGGKRLFVPQKPYMPIDTLKNVICYPEGGRSYSRKAICEAMRKCRIDYLTGQLEQEADWGKVLSLGEQQRVAFARIILQRPQWLFLDEATSALDEANQVLMYEQLLAELPEAAIISVGHRLNICRYHNKNLVLDGSGGWQIFNL